MAISGASKDPLHDSAGCREVSGGGSACDVSVPMGIHRRRKCAITAAAAEIGGINKRWVNDERLAGIVGADLELDLVLAEQKIISRYSMLSASPFLINESLSHAYPVTAQCHPSLALL